MDELKKIKSQLKRLQLKASLIEAQSNNALEQIRKLMLKHGLSVSDIERYISKNRASRSATKRATRGASTPSRLYANPKSGETWSGRGRPPEWIRTAKNRDVFLVEGTASSVSQARGRSKSSKPVAGKYSGKKAAQPTALKKFSGKKVFGKEPAAKKGASIHRPPGTGPGYAPAKSPGTGPGYVKKHVNE